MKGHDSNELDIVSSRITQHQQISVVHFVNKRRKAGEDVEIRHLISQ